MDIQEIVPKTAPSNVWWPYHQRQMHLEVSHPQAASEVGIELEINFFQGMKALLPHTCVCDL